MCPTTRPNRNERVVKFFAKCFILTACLLGALAQAAPVKVALLTGDAQSAAAIGAITELRRDAALKDITVRSFPRTELSDADRQFVRQSDIIIGYTRYGALLRSLAPEIRAAADRGSFYRRRWRARPGICRPWF